MLEYAFKFMELSLFALAFVAYEKLKMNHSKVGLIPILRRKYPCISTLATWIYTAPR